MCLASTISGLFKWCQFASEVILFAVGWYLRFSLSYRNVEELLAAGVLVGTYPKAVSHQKSRLRSCYARVKLNGKSLYSGFLVTPEEAAAASDATARNLLGEFA